jgi:hypothetical protein
MKLSKVFSEPVLYLLALALALAIRMTNLGQVPLTDYEASWALQAMDSMRGSHPIVGSQVAYVQLTSLLFFIFPPNNLLARFWPVLLGSLLVLAPYLIRDWVGRKAAVILAFALALDPGLAAVSRQAGGAMIAVAGGWLALGFWLKRKPVLAGVALGISFMGGESFWPGLLGLALAFGIAKLGNLVEINAQPADGNNEDSSTRGIPLLRELIIAVVTTILLAGSLFMIVPRGLSGVFTGLTVYLGGWGQSSGVSSLQILAALLVYQPLALLLGIWGSIRSWRAVEPLDRFLSLWVLTALLLVLIYPSRQVGDLCWVLVPLLILAARQLERSLWVEVESKIPAFGMAVLVTVILIFVWINLVGISEGLQTNLPAPNRWVVILIGILIVAIVTFLVGWGWSMEPAIKGSLWGMYAALFLYLVFSLTHAVHLRPQLSAELWDRDYPVPQAGLLVRTLDSLSDRHTGRPSALDVTVVGVQSPALRWVLRDYEKVAFTDQLAGDIQPSVVITQQEEQPKLAASYRGEGFLWYEYTDWSLMLDSEYFPWWVQRISPQQKVSLIMWARTDIFPDSQGNITTAPQP